MGIVRQKSSRNYNYKLESLKTTIAGRMDKNSFKSSQKFGFFSATSIANGHQSERLTYKILNFILFTGCM